MRRRATLLLALVMLLAAALWAPQAEEQTTPAQWLENWYAVGNYLRETGAYPYMELRRGDSGYEVIILQLRLAQLNYYTKAIDPKFGPGTEAGVRRFQQVSNLKANGVATVETQRLLFMSSALPLPGTIARSDISLIPLPAYFVAGEGPKATKKPGDSGGTSGGTTNPPPEVTVKPGGSYTLKPQLPTIDIGSFLPPVTRDPYTLKPNIDIPIGDLVGPTPKLLEPLLPELPPIGP